MQSVGLFERDLVPVVERLHDRAMGVLDLIVFDEQTRR
jgi:hypothetical protein